MRRRRPLSDRFHEKFVQEPVSGCWLWTASVSRGYGHMGLGGHTGTSYAHRVAWTLYKGEIPPGMCVCHRCDVPLCVNPDHLFLGTHADNVADKISKGRQGPPPRGELSGKAKLTEAKVVQIRALRGRLSQREIGNLFGVAKGTITGIQNGDTWRHVAAKCG